MPTFDVTVHGRRYHVEIPEPGASPLQVIVDGQPFEVQLSGEAVAPVAPRKAAAQAELPPPRHVAAAPAAAPVGEVGHVIMAPMPGTILSVPVTAGQAVEAGEVVCVLEAMKMKNPLRAAIAGTVAEIAVSPGDTVTHGQLLVRLA